MDGKVPFGHDLKALGRNVEPMSKEELKRLADKDYEEGMRAGMEVIPSALLQHPIIEGESKLDRKKRLLKERIRRYRQTPKYKERKRMRDKLRYFTAEQREDYRRMLVERGRDLPFNIAYDTEALRKKREAKQRTRERQKELERVKRATSVAVSVDDLRELAQVMNKEAPDPFDRFRMSSEERESLHLEHTAYNESVKQFCIAVSENQRYGKQTDFSKEFFTSFRFKSVHLLNSAGTRCAKCYGTSAIVTPIGRREFVTSEQDWDNSPFNCSLLKDIPNGTFL